MSKKNTRNARGSFYHYLQGQERGELRSDVPANEIAHHTNKEQPRGPS